MGWSIWPAFAPLGAQIQVIQATTDDINFHKLAKQVREAIERNEPETALDRLHTYVVRFIRELCDKHGIAYDKDKPLHSFYGEYIKHLKKIDLIKSTMTERILKSSISTLGNPCKTKLFFSQLIFYTFFRLIYFTLTGFMLWLAVFSF